MRHPDRAQFDIAGAADVEERVSRRDSQRLIIAAAGAVLLHAGAAFGFAFWTPPEPVAPPGEMMITIDLEPAIASAAAEPIAGVAAESAPQEPTPPEPEPAPDEEVAEQVPPPPEPVREPEEPVKEEVVPPEPTTEPETVQENIEPPPPAEKAEVAVAPEKVVPKPKPRPKAKPKPKAPSQAASSASAKRADIAGSGARASPSDLARYVGRLRAALERRKRYPAAAGGVSGTASLRFTINRSGQVTSFTLVRSSGNAALDAATRSMVQGARLPPIPEELPNSITVGVPVNFRVR